MGEGETRDDEEGYIKNGRTNKSEKRKKKKRGRGKKCFQDFQKFVYERSGKRGKEESTTITISVILIIKVRESGEPEWRTTLVQCYTKTRCHCLIKLIAFLFSRS